MVLDWLWRFLDRHIASEVPDELSACLDCGIVHCVEGKFRKCPNRLARAAGLRAMRVREQQETGTEP